MDSTVLGILNPCLRNVRDVYRIHKAELSAIKNEEEKYKRLVELNVQEQYVNVLKTAEVQHAFRTTGITVHGWVFDIKTGKIIDLKVDFHSIVERIAEIYRID